MKQHKESGIWVSDNGQELRNGNTNRKIKGWKDHLGYQRVLVKVDGKRKVFWVHRLVAQCYLPNPEGLDEVDHIDRNKQNNDYRNLRWSTRHKNCINVKPRSKITKYRNVWKQENGRWSCFIKNEGVKREHIGTFDTEQEAFEALKNKITQKGGDIQNYV